MPKEPAVQKAVKTGVVRYDANKCYFECVVCGSPLSGEASVAQHLDGSKHREAAARYAVRHCNDGSNALLHLLPPNTMAAAKKGIVAVSGNNAFQCTICGTTLTGIRPTEDHLAGDDHKKKANAQRVASTFTQPSPAVHPPWVPITPPVSALPAASSNLADVDLIARNMRESIVVSTDDKTTPFICNVCNNKSFNSPSTLLDHLRSKKHQNMEKESQLKAAVCSPEKLPPSTLGFAGNKTMQYNLLSTPRGFVYVFNYTFSGQDKWQRSGADTDSQNLQETFTQMGYQVFIHKDLTERESYEEFGRIVRDNRLNGIDALIMCFLSHGKDPYTFYANDKEELDLFEIRKQFSDRRCPFMKKKPKIFFTNYCRGDQMEKKELDKVEVLNDVVTIHAATEGIMAKRSINHGTCFVRSLCEVLKQHASDTELRDIYAYLEFAMKEKRGTKPMWEDYGFRRFYFTPQ